MVVKEHRDTKDFIGYTFSLTLRLGLSLCNPFHLSLVLTQSENYDHSFQVHILFDKDKEENVQIQSFCTGGMTVNSQSFKNSDFVPFVKL